MEPNRFPNAMCYCPAFPEKTVTVTHRCPTCRTKYEYELSLYGGERKYDKYVEEERNIDDYVSQIKKMGYEVKVEHMYSFIKEFFSILKSKTVYKYLNSIITFPNEKEDDYTVNVVTIEDCEALLQFLKGNNAMRLYGDWVWIKRYYDILSRILAIKTDEP